LGLQVPFSSKVAGMLACSLPYDDKIHLLLTHACTHLDPHAAASWAHPSPLSCPFAFALARRNCFCSLLGSSAVVPCAHPRPLSQHYHSTKTCLHLVATSLGGQSGPHLIWFPCISMAHSFGAPCGDTSSMHLLSVNPPCSAVLSPRSPTFSSAMAHSRSPMIGPSHGTISNPHMHSAGLSCSHALCCTVLCRQGVLVLAPGCIVL
jgi:hypothetical protein